MKVLFVNEPGVRALLPMPDCIPLMRDALTTLARGDVVLPLRSKVQLPDGSGLLGLMPGYLGTPRSFGLKVVSVMPGNHGTPYDSHQGVVMLFGLEHGEPLAILDATAITAIRTAAASAAATDALARPDAGDLALIGSGTQARSHLAAMQAVRPLRRVRVWSRTRAHAERLAQEEAARCGVAIEVSASAADAVRDADLVCTTTASREPVLEGAWLAPGAHVNAVGACFASSRELDTEAVRRSRFFTDCRESCVNEAGDFRIARDEGAIDDAHLVGELGDVFLGRVPGRTTRDDITVYESLGIAIEDLAAAHFIHRRASESGTGTWLEWGWPAGDAMTTFTVQAPTRAEIRAARDRMAGLAVRTPLVRLPGTPGEREVWLKLETLQPIGSFKIRGAASALGLAPRAKLARGVYTASAGNMAQGVAWWARENGVPCTVVVPDHAPRAKLDAIEALGARIVPVPFERWWQVLVERGYAELDGFFVHPVSDPAVIAGNATIGLEILEDLPGVAGVLVPYGGGGLSCGIASALRAADSTAPVFACEVETAAPLVAAFRAGAPTAIDYRASFVDGIGGRGILAEMWPLASTLLAGSCVVTLDEIAESIRTLVARARVVAEGAGGAGLAAARSGRHAIGPGGGAVPLPAGPLVCVVSGGNLDALKLAAILEGRTP